MGIDPNHLLTAGHTACAGCPMPVIIRHVLDVLGKDTIVVNATSCSEIISSQYPTSAFKTPYIHSLFENTPAVATGVVRSLRAQGNDHTQVVVIAGDGATYDIGFGAMSGAMERNEDILYICYDNEAYMNTGVQRSSATPPLAKTTTSPVGSKIHGKMMPKKPIVEICAAHGIPYSASASIAYLPDFKAKLEKAKAMKGFRFIDVISPCVPGWGYDPAISIELSRLAVETGMWELFEIENGVRKDTFKPGQLKPVELYLKPQKRFKHLTDAELKGIQKKILERTKIPLLK
ncbi:MAG: thiamine pyrophosphate-dependent enzyme [Candidatus Undinarchaeales archaeon]|jgi:pyruvate ferredoxin oxidoreductase beta subunit|nr:thiamine pyrophosphate-dependent enzyme [Candidatus Undinarchaeales archaeon]